MAKLGFELCDLDLWPLTLTFGMDTSVIGNNSWNFMVIQWQEHDEKDVTDGRTDRQTDGGTDGRPEVFLELLGHS